MLTSYRGIGRTLISITRVTGGYTQTGPTRLTGRVRANKTGTRVSAVFRVPAGNWSSRLISASTMYLENPLKIPKCAQWVMTGVITCHSP